MSDLIWLSEAQMRRIEPYFPLSHGVPRVDDRRVISGIIFVIRNGLRWRDAPREYGPHKTIYNRFIRWSRMGVFNRIFAALAAKGGRPDRLMQRRFVFDPTTGQPVLWYEGTGTAATNRRYLSQDERGSVISVSDSTSASLGINSYDEYGKPGASNLGRYQYTGQKWIGEAGLYDYHFRDYVPQHGIFAQTDPIGQEDNANLYAYVGGDPANRVDPLGLAATVNCAIDICIVGGQRNDGPGGGGSVGGAAPSSSPGEGNDQCVAASVGGCDPIPVVGKKKDRHTTGLWSDFMRGVRTTYCAIIPHPSGVNMLSVSASLELPGLTATLGLGVAIDPHGNVALPSFGFLGGGIGGAAGVTGNYTTSNARDFKNFSGAFVEGGAMLGIGPGGGVSKFAGPGGVSGKTYSAGAVLGGDVFLGGSYTDVGRTINLDEVAGCP